MEQCKIVIEIPFGEAVVYVRIMKGQSVYFSGAMTIKDVQKLIRMLDKVNIANLASKFNLRSPVR